MQTLNFKLISQFFIAVLRFLRSDELRAIVRGSFRLISFLLQIAVAILGVFLVMISLAGSNND